MHVFIMYIGEIICVLVFAEPVDPYAEDNTERVRVLLYSVCDDNHTNAM